MVKTIHTILLAWAAALLGIVVSAPSHAVEERWIGLADTEFQHYTPENGLPQGTGAAIEEDSDGFVWIGTQAGLARWDGYRFRTYQPDAKAPGALPDNFVQALHRDAHGRLWIGTSGGGLALYDRDADRFISFRDGPGGLENINVLAIADDEAGGVLVGTSHGLDDVDPSSGRIAHLHGNDGADPLASHISTLLRDRAGDLWIGTDHGLYRCPAGSNRSIAVPLLPGNDQQPIPIALYQSDDGLVWVGTRRHGAFVLPSGAKNFRPVEDATPEGMALVDERVNAIVQVRPHVVWLGLYNHGIVEVDTQDFRTRRIRRDSKVASSLTSDAVISLHRDRAGSIWVGTEAGVSRYDPAQGVVLSLFGDSSRRNGLSDSDVDAVLAMPDGTIWLALGRGVEILDPVRGVLAALRPDMSHPAQALPEDRTTSLARAPDGGVFIGTHRGLYYADAHARHVRRITLKSRDPNARVDALLLEGQRLWVGSFDAPLAVMALDGSDASIPRSLLDRVTDERVQTIEPAADHRIWIGTSHGLNLLDPEGQAIERILPDLGNPTALSSAAITSILTDPQGRVWVGTNIGINILESRDAQGRPRFRRLTTAQGMPHDGIDKLLLDASGNVWASTDGGIAVIDSRTFSVRALRRADGVSFMSHWANSGMATASGELLFGAVGGLTVVRPERLTQWTYVPPIVVTDARIGGSELPVNRFNSAAAGVQAPLNVPSDSNSLAIEFSALDYSAPERNVYAYRLDGFDRGWIQTDSTRRLAAYTNLSPGLYTLQLSGSNREGVWSERPLEIPIRVLPAWYQTVWAKLGGALLGSSLVLILIQARTAYLRSRQRELESQVATRTVELEESRQQLERMAYSDSLTGLPNRRLFAVDVAKQIAIARRYDKSFALLLIDLDRFKQVNDTLGHGAGDAVLIETAARLRGAVRESDSVARLGGDEFVVLLSMTESAATVDAVCHRLIDQFAEPVLFETHQIPVSPSIGVALYPHDGETQDTLYKSADLALYEAKAAGRNTWRWYAMETDEG